MPATSAVAKKSTAGTKNASVVDVTPTRISSRVRKEKFNVKELFSHKEVYGDFETTTKKTPKKKPDSPKASVLKESVLAKSQTNKIITPKVVPIKPQSSTKVVQKKFIDDSAPGPSKIYETPTTYKVVQVTRVTPRTNPLSEKSKSPQPSDGGNKLANCIFTENNIDSVIENPSALGLDIVVTRLSESENKNSDDSDKSKNNVVTISKVGEDTIAEPVTIVPTKLDKKDDRSKTKELDLISESLPKGLSITPTVKLSESVIKKNSGSDPSELDRRLEKELESILNDSSCILEPIVERKDELSHPYSRKEVEKKKRRTEDINGKYSENDSFKRNKFDPEFTRYFIVSRSLVEHNDSLDSESENDEPVLSHFLPPHILRKAKATIYDLATEVSLTKPAWNLHIMQDTGSYLLARVARGPHGLPVMNKVIELDQNFAAKVYVNQIYQRQFTGVYDSYESIRELVTSVDQL